jgi:hypothetical protein
MYPAPFIDVPTKLIWQSPKPERPYADSESMLATIRWQVLRNPVSVCAQETVSEMFWRLAAEYPIGH